MPKLRGKITEKRQGLSKMQSLTESVPVTKETETDDTSAFFREFISRVYEMPYEKVTKKQLSRITYLHIFWENHCRIAEYIIGEGDMERVELSEDLTIHYQDLQKFTGLQGIHIGNSNLAPGDLKGLSELTQVWSRNNPEELSVIIENPENITSLGCYNVSSMAKIDSFENLEQLHIECSTLIDPLENISELSALKNLKKLQIVGGDKISDFGVLYSLDGLEELAIDSESLKDISFVRDMPVLQSLSIEDSIVLDISALRDLDSIKNLELTDNYEIQDYSALSNLTSLESLNLELCGSSQMPDATGWKNLKNLTISGAESIGFLKSLPNLQSLHLAGCNCSEYEALTFLQKLESLKLSGIYGDVESLDVLAELENLKVLDISSMSLYGNAEAIFGIPHLEELNINDCSFGLDFENMPENDSLKVLYMDRIKLWDNISVAYDGIITYLDYDEVHLADCISFVEKFPNLEELYVQSNKLTEVAFTESIPNLRKLDITDNYITDLRPLEKLNHLEIVWCGENSISQKGNPGEDVIVIMDSKAEEKWGF